MVRQNKRGDPRRYRKKYRRKKIKVCQIYNAVIVQICIADIAEAVTTRIPLVGISHHRAVIGTVDVQILICVDRQGRASRIESEERLKRRARPTLRSSVSERPGHGRSPVRQCSTRGRGQGHTVTEHPKARTLREFYEAFDDADPGSAVRQYLAANVIWHVAGANPLAGVFHGPDEVWQAMLRYGEHSGQTLHLDTRSIFADDEHAVAIHQATATPPGFRYEAHEVDLFHIEDGQIVEMWSFSEDQEATDRVWS